ncbi:uncharacterized protein BBOV_IV005310 [Babesia bovis T2Bo]|uniref:Succinate dehydrogenase assembly factor 4, mitochondrial n=1 Tax=Babesia bovis TaxID=5865 RepID=A7AQS3_BABBO|nr:uncharacterized protein BBOV_IV005310 [Babesia bovis T2Bo]EDO06892.1 hypothetical protein BBOV_IV005310 [Babesia bovis T2Bo]|eukprot:XP_001610460.1 hypothetical protein [Babesia bovis T2Bo]
MASESAARRRLASTYIFGCSAEPMLGARFVTVESERLRPSVSMEKPAATAVESCDNGSANGSLTCTGEEDDTEGTERSRTAHRTSVTTDAKDASQTKPILKNGAKEFGNVYKMHEPTMFGDWSHMGRVSDF